MAKLHMTYTAHWPVRHVQLGHRLGDRTHQLVGWDHPGLDKTLQQRFFIKVQRKFKHLFQHGGVYKRQ